jgi:radical SAM superfamily enzyme YgiQ (UPF0313 family)
MTYRGCPKRCTFCPETQVLNYRQFSSIITEIKDIIDKRKYQAIFFDDSIFTARSNGRKHDLEDLIRYLGHSRIEWGCQARMGDIDKKTLQLMEENGCTYIYFGIESADDRLFDDMQEGSHGDKIVETMRLLSNTGVRVGLSLCFSMAIPGAGKMREAKENVRKTINFIKELSDRCGNIVLINLDLATFYPGTKMTAVSEKRIDFTQPIIHHGYPCVFPL